MKNLNVVVVGSGMYVCGRGTDGYGTIMPAICKWKKKDRLGNVCVVGTAPKNIKIAKKKIDEMQRDTNVHISIEYLPIGSCCNGQSYKEAIRRIPKPAVCIVAVPDNLHRAVAGLAIDNGLHTLAVKPLTPTLKEVRELIAIQDKKCVYCAVEFHKRLDEANLKLKDVFASGVLGDPLYFVAEYSQRKSVPTEHFKKWAEETNIFQYLGIHYADIVYFITGATPLRATAVGQKGLLRSNGFDTYDAIEAIVEWRMPSGKNFISNIITNWIDPETTSSISDQRIKIVGTKGRYESDQKYRGIKIVTDEKGIEEPNPYFCSPYGPRGAMDYRGYGIDSVCQFLDDALNVESGKVAVADLEKKRPTFKQSIAPTAVLEAVNKSLKQRGAWMEIRI